MRRIGIIGIARRQSENVRQGFKVARDALGVDALGPTLLLAVSRCRFSSGVGLASGTNTGLSTPYSSGSPIAFTVADWNGDGMMDVIWSSGPIPGVMTVVTLRT